MLYANACNTDHANDKTHWVQITTSTIFGIGGRLIGCCPNSCSHLDYNKRFYLLVDTSALRTTPKAPPSQHNEIFSSPEIHPICVVKVNAGSANPNVDVLLMAG